MKLRVRYSVVFEAEIEVENKPLSEGPTGIEYANEYADEIADIKIPEDRVSKYQPDTFDVESVMPVTAEPWEANNFNGGPK